MNYLTHAVRALLVLAGIGATMLAQAQKVKEFTTIELAMEAPAGSVTLPSDTTDTLVMAPCAGCARKSFQITPATAYFLGERQVNLAQLRAAAVAHPSVFLTISYVVKTSTVTRISTAVENPKILS